MNKNKLNYYDLILSDIKNDKINKEDFIKVFKDEQFAIKLNMITKEISELERNTMQLTALKEIFKDDFNNLNEEIQHLIDYENSYAIYRDNHFELVDFLNDPDMNAIEVSKIPIVLKYIYNSKMKCRITNNENHKWIAFIVSKNNYYIQFDKGCLYSSNNKYFNHKDIQKFEENIKEKYGASESDNAYNFLYRFYMFMIEWIRLYSGGRKFEKEIKYNKFISLIDFNEIKEKLSALEDRNAPKIRFWFDILKNCEYDKIIYLHDSCDSFANDLIILQYLDNFYGITINSLLDIINVSDKDIYNSLKDYVIQKEFKTFKII